MGFRKYPGEDPILFICSVLFHSIQVFLVIFFFFYYISSESAIISFFFTSQYYLRYFYNYYYLPPFVFCFIDASQT